jgi:hypothetical protein
MPHNARHITNIEAVNRALHRAQLLRELVRQFLTQFDRGCYYHGDLSLLLARMRELVEGEK